MYDTKVSSSILQRIYSGIFMILLLVELVVSRLFKEKSKEIKYLTLGFILTTSLLTIALGIKDSIGLTVLIIFIGSIFLCSDDYYKIPEKL